MGLDNIPRNYACEKQGTAIRVFMNKVGEEVVSEFEGEGSISCERTQAAKGCPWQNDSTRPVDGAVTGMFGTNCWYRGKWGNRLLEALVDETPPVDFYGDGETGLSPDQCDRLADYMNDALDSYGDKKVILNAEDITFDIQYAIWWLRWVAENCDGSDVWF